MEGKFARTGGSQYGAREMELKKGKGVLCGRGKNRPRKSGFYRGGGEAHAWSMGY